MIKKGGTVVVGQDQGKVGGDFDPEQSWIGEVSGMNVWGVVLSEGDVVTENHDWRVFSKSVVRWSQLYASESLHGDVSVYP